jgi:hypothetical protein
MANEREAYFLQQARAAWTQAEKAATEPERAAWRTIAEKYEDLAELAVKNGVRIPPS